jgi:hypothetical protein
MRTYKKRQPTLRHCVHCHAPFESAHKRRIYCGNSCSTLAYYARKAAITAAALPLAALPLPVTSATPILAEPAAAKGITLDWNGQNVAVLGGANLLAQFGSSVVKRLWEAFTEPTLPANLPHPALAERVADPLDWLPAGLLTGAAPRVSLPIPTLGQSFVFVQLTYLGHTLFYQPTQRVLLWRVMPGQMMTLEKAEHLALVAELPVYEELRPQPQPQLQPQLQLAQPVGRPQYLG